MKQGYRVMVTDHIRNEYKFYVSLVAGTLLAYGWVSTQFLTTAQAQVTHDQISKEISQVGEQQKKLSVLLETLVSKQSLSNVQIEIKTNESEQFQVSQFMRVNGSDPQSERRLQQLKAERNDLEIRRNCIISKNPICE